MSKGRKKKLRLILGIVLASVFILGIIVGLLISTLFSEKEPVRTVEKTVSVDATEVKPQEATNTVNVYVPKRERVLGAIPRNSYITENFVIEDGFMAYYDENGSKISHLGIDISYHQEDVDWDMLKESPVEFVMLRCGYRGYTEGGLVEDSKFREYAAECNAREIPIGVYFFSQAINEEEAKKEADFVINLIKDYKISYPVAFDTELVSDSSARTNEDSITDEDRTRICVTFCEAIKEAGYYPMIYAAENRLRRDLITEDIQEYDLWAPQYFLENDFLYDFTIWQYTEDGNVPGIDGKVDINISMVDYADFVPALREAVNTGGVIDYGADNVPISVSDDAGAVLDIPIDPDKNENGAARPER